MKTYKSFSAGGTGSTSGVLIYTVPTGCSQAKLTFVSGAYNGNIGIKKSGTESIISLPNLSWLSEAATGSEITVGAVNLVNMGIYLDPGDQIYAMTATDYFVSGILEYES